MKKRSFYMWLVGVILCGVFLTLVFGRRVEEGRARQVYEQMEEIVPEKGELAKYGIRENTFVYMPMLAGMIGITVLLGVGAAVLSIWYVKEQGRKVGKMEEYCEAILDGKYALDLRDNEEGEFSVLKNKVYDITVMLREQNRYLEQNKKDMERMIADISHQLKTPITSLNMVNEILYMDLPKEKKMEFLDNMQKDLLKIEWLVKTILNMAKLDSKTLKLEKREVRASEFSQEVIEHFKVFCEMNESEIHVKDAENITFLCDRKWTKEAFNNIIKNAIEHGAKNVTMSWEDNHIYTSIQITDDGNGIRKEELPHIFERFYKTKDSLENSLGLGLAFCKSIISHQDGEIKVQSKKGIGTKFIIKFYKNLP